MELNPHDIKQLANIISEITDAQSPNAVNGTHYFYYFFPKNAEQVEATFEILKKYNLPVEKHLTGLNKRAFPVIRLPITQNAIEDMPQMFKLVDAVKRAQEEKRSKQQEPKSELNDDAMFNPQDIAKLAAMAAQVSRAKSKSASGKIENFFYYIPKDAASYIKAMTIFEQYAIPALTHSSSLNNYACPVIRFPIQDESNPHTAYMIAMLNKIKLLKDTHNAQVYRQGQNNVAKKGLAGMMAKVQRFFGGNNRQN